MSQDDDATIERVARAMVTADNGDPEQIIYRRTGPDSFEPLGSAWELFKPKARAAITAYLSALPERELLAEALEALSRLITASSHIHHWHDGHHGGMVVSGSHVHALWEETDRARAAADKIRAALTQEKQT